jgi:hypothetical protein
MLPNRNSTALNLDGSADTKTLQDVSTSSLDSVSVGRNAGKINGGVGNAFIGVQSGQNNSTTSYTTAIGYQSAASTQNLSYSTFVGAYSGANATSGSEVVFVGYSAGQYSGTAGNITQSVGIGAYALQQNIFGSGTVAVGHSAGQYSRDANFNTMIGAQAGQQNTSGNYNTMAGYKSGLAAFRGNENTYFGAFAGYSNAQGSANTLIGTRSGELLYNGNFNVFIGYKSGQNFKFGDYNIAIGPFSLQNASGGSSNVVIGSGAGAAGTATNNSVIIGTGAGLNAAIDRSVVIGTDALSEDKQGSSMVVLGYQAGQNILSGSSNTFIGAQVAQNFQYGDYNVVIGAYTMQNATSGYSNVIIGNAAAINSGENIRSVVIGTGSASNANLINSVIIGTNTAPNANSIGSVIIGTDSAQTLGTGDSNILIGNGANVNTPITNNAIVISSSNSVAGSGSISIGSEIDNTRYNSILIGKNLNTDADQTVIIGNDINIRSIRYFKDPFAYNLEESVLVDAKIKLHATEITYQDSLIRPDGTILDTANLGLYTHNIENSFTNPYNRTNNAIQTELLCSIPGISNVAVVPDIVVPIRTTYSCNYINNGLINSFTPKKQQPIFNLTGVYNDIYTLSYNFEIPKTIYMEDKKTVNLINVQPLKGIWSTNIVNYKSIIQINDSKTSIYGNVFACGKISSSLSATIIYNTDGSVAFRYLQPQVSQYNTTDAFLIKYNSEGFVQWYTVAASYGGDEYTALMVDNNENIYCTGYYGSNLNGNTSINSNIRFYNSNLSSYIIGNVTSNIQCASLIKYNTYGILQWADVISTQKYDTGFAIDIMYTYPLTNTSLPFLYTGLTSGGIISGTIQNITINTYSSNVSTISNTSIITPTIHPTTLYYIFSINVITGVILNSVYSSEQISSFASYTPVSPSLVDNFIYVVYLNISSSYYYVYRYDSNLIGNIPLNNPYPARIKHLQLNPSLKTYIRKNTYFQAAKGYLNKGNFPNVVVIGTYNSALGFFNNNLPGSDITKGQAYLPLPDGSGVYVAVYTMAGSIGAIRSLTHINSSNITLDQVSISVYDSIFISGTYTKTLTVYNPSPTFSTNPIAFIQNTTSNYGNGGYLVEFNTTGNLTTTTSSGTANFVTNIPLNGAINIITSLIGNYIYVFGSYSSPFQLIDPDGVLNNIYYPQTNPLYPNIFMTKFEIIPNSLQTLLLGNINIPSSSELIQITSDYICAHDSFQLPVDYQSQRQNIISSSNTEILLPSISSKTDQWTISFWYKLSQLTSNNSILFISPNIDIIYLDSNGYLYTSSNQYGLGSPIISTENLNQYKLTTNTLYNFTFTGYSNITTAPYATTNTYIYINGFYQTSLNSNINTASYLFNSSNDYIASIGTIENVFGWSRMLTYNEIFTLYNKTERYVPTINDSIYLNISFILNLQLNQSQTIQNNLVNSPLSNAIIIGNSNSFTTSIINNLPVVNLRNFNTSNSILNINFPKFATQLKTGANTSIINNLNVATFTTQNVTFPSGSFTYAIDTSGSLINTNNGIYIAPTSTTNVVTQLPHYGYLSQYILASSSAITYYQQIEYLFARNDQFIITPIANIIDVNSNVYGVSASSNYTVTINFNTYTVLKTATVLLEQYSSRKITKNDIITIQTSNEFIADNFIFKPKSIGGLLEIGISDYTSSNVYYNTNTLSNAPIIRYSDIKNDYISLRSSNLIGQYDQSQNIVFNVWTVDQYGNSNSPLTQIINGITTPVSISLQCLCGVTSNALFIDPGLINTSNTSITIQKFQTYSNILSGVLWNSLSNNIANIDYNGVYINIQSKSLSNGILYNCNLNQVGNLQNYMKYTDILNSYIRYISFIPTISNITNEILNINIAYYTNTGAIYISPQYTIKLNNYITQDYVNSRGLNITALNDTTRTLYGPSLSAGLQNDGYIWSPSSRKLAQGIAYSSISSPVYLSWVLSNQLGNTFTPPSPYGKQYTTTYITYSYNSPLSIIQPNSIQLSNTSNIAYYDVHDGTNVSLSTILRQYLNYDVNNMQNIYMYVEQNPSYGIIQNTVSGQAVSKCSYNDLINDAIVYQHLGYYGETYIDPTVFYKDTIIVSFSTTPYDLTLNTLSVQFNILPKISVIDNYDTYIFADSIRNVISSNYIVPSNNIIINTNSLIPSSNTNLLIPVIENLIIADYIPLSNSSFQLSSNVLANTQFPYTMGFYYSLVNSYLADFNNSNSVALTFAKNSLGMIPTYQNALLTHQKIRLNEYIDTNTVYDPNHTFNSNQLNTEKISYVFTPYFASDLLNEELFSATFSINVNPSMYFQEQLQNVNFLSKYAFSINFFDVNSNVLQKFAFSQNSLTECVLTTSDIIYPTVQPLNFNSWNTIEIINNDPLYDYSNVSLFINNTYIDLEPKITSFDLRQLTSIQFIVEITNPSADDTYNFLSSFSHSNYVNSNLVDSLQKYYKLVNSHTDILLQNFVININTNSVTTSNLSNSNVTNVILGKAIGVKGTNNICIGNKFTTAGQNSIIVGNEIGSIVDATEIYESIVIGNQSFTNTLVRNITSIGNNNLNNLSSVTNQHKVLSFLQNKPVIIGNDIDGSKVDYHINIGNTFLKTTYNNTNQIYLGNSSEIIGIGYLSNVDLSTQYQLQVNGSVTFNGDISYYGNIYQDGILADEILSGANITPSYANAKIIYKWLLRTIKLYNPNKSASFWSNPIEFTALPIRIFNNPPPSNPTDGAFMGSLYIPDNRVLFIPRSSTVLGIYNPSTNLYSTIPGFPGNNAYNGGILAPDGRVVFVPANTNSIGIFLPATNKYTTIRPNKPTISLYENQYKGGVLLPNQLLLFAPFNATNIGILDISYINSSNNNYGYSQITPADPVIPGQGIYNGCVLIPDGRVIFVPGNSLVIGIYDYTSSYNFGYTTLAIQSVGNYSGGVLLADGRVLFVPIGGQNIGIFNPTISTINGSPTGYSIITVSDLIGEFAGGVLLPDGNVLFIPSGITSETSIITIFNTNTNLITVVPSNFSMVGHDYSGGTLLKDGRVVCSPFSNTNIGILSGYNTSTHQELCLHPMFNKL